MLKILIVEDDDVLRNTIKHTLEQHGQFYVETVPNGLIAKDVLSEKAFDLVISDINMPSLTGLELTQWIKENSKAVPIILMTGISEYIEEVSTKTLGVAAILPKPFQTEELLTIISNVLPQ